MHDAAHRSIAPKKEWINQTMGWISQLWIGPQANFWAFKYLHLEHHKYTNDPEKDPDYYASGVWWSLPFRWFTVDINYWRFYIPLVLPWASKRSMFETCTVWLYHINILMLLYWSWKNGYLPAICWNWILPSRISIALLAFAFDFLPHYPHGDTRQYKHTHNFDFGILNGPATFIFMYQNYHALHHRYPYVSFWEYAVVWDEKKREMMSKGTQTIHLSSLVKL